MRKIHKVLGVLSVLGGVLTLAEHVDYISVHFSDVKAAMNLISSLNWSTGSLILGWALLAVGILLLVSDYLPRKWSDLPWPNRYVLASEALNYIAFRSHWSKQRFLISVQQVAAEEFRRMAESGAIKTKGIRRVGSLSFLPEDVPPSHWTVAFLSVPQQWFAAPYLSPAQIEGTHLSTELIGGLSGSPFYADVQVKSRDLYRTWPKDRWWHQVGRAIMSQK